MAARFVVSLGLVLTVVVLSLGIPLNALVPAARAQSLPGSTTTGHTVGGSVVSSDVSALPPVAAEAVVRRDFSRPRSASRRSTMTTASVGTAPTVATMPSPNLTFDGLGFNSPCGGVQCGGGWPPDNNGDVSPSFYVEAVNVAIGIFDKKTGTQRAAFTFNSLWSAANTGTPCDAQNQGDPSVVYDLTSGLWTIADFAFATDSLGNPVAPFYECLALTPDSTLLGSGWRLFAVRTDDAGHPWFGDYPKMGAWPDGLRLTANMFDPATSLFQEARFWSFDIANAYRTGQLRFVVTDTNSAAYYSFLPSNYRGTPPPAGTPSYLVGEDQSDGAYDVFTYQVDYAVPSNTRLIGPTLVSERPFTVPPSGIPQPGTTQTLDSLDERVMMQAQYRNIGGQESVWVAHTIGLGGSSNVAGIGWAQIGVSGGAVQATPIQQGVWSNGGDGRYRWVPSLAVDRLGDMAVGYSVSDGTSTFPSIRYAGRLASDPAGTLGQGEATLFAGSGAQTGLNRWGDYTAMTIDPTDDCTFWYVNEYYPTTGQSWKTRIGSFTFPQCASAAPTTSPVSGPTPTVGFNPLVQPNPTLPPRSYLPIVSR